MGERKVLNKYFPPDFDPSLVPRRKRPKNKQIEVRMMLPFSLQCNTCGEYMYRGKKFNSRKEDVLEEDYKGIRIFRFYIKCITCSSEITFKTDPQHGDYVAEHGCQRNFEPWRENEQEEQEMVQQRQEEEQGDSMKALENRTLDSKREMDILDALDEIKAINQRHARVDTDALLQQHAATSRSTGAHEQLGEQHQQEEEEEEDERQARLAFQKQQQQQQKRMRPDALSSVLLPAAKRPAWTANSKEVDAGPNKTKAEAVAQDKAFPTIKVVKKKKLAATTSNKPKKSKAVPTAQAAPIKLVTSLVAQYSDSSSDQEEDTTS